jgi:hypothetical protein
MAEESLQDGRCRLAQPGHRHLCRWSLAQRTKDDAAADGIA